MRAVLRPALVLTLLFSLLCGLAYPAAVTALAQALFPHEANGSLVRQGDRVVGSELIGQTFAAPGYFQGRPSATSPAPYDAAASTGSNLGPTNPALTDTIAGRVAALHEGTIADASARVPADLVTASGSGLDPHISPASAHVQIERVARARGLDPAEVRRLVDAHVEPRTLGVLGEPRINVLRLNLALDARKPLP